MRSFNYTGRKKIALENIMLLVKDSSENRARFDAEFDLSEYNFPAESKVIVEAYYQRNWMRFNFGTIVQPQTPDTTTLDEFSDIDDVRFRVKITEYGADKVLGMADKIKPIINDAIESEVVGILPIKSADLNGSVWKVEYSDEGTTLILDKTLGDKNTIFSDTEFYALVIPSVFREILVRIMLHENNYDLDDMTDWRSQWLFVCNKYATDEYPSADSDIEDIYDWIDDVISRFCRAYKILDDLNKYREESDK